MGEIWSCSWSINDRSDKHLDWVRFGPVHGQLTKSIYWRTLSAMTHTIPTKKYLSRKWPIEHINQAHFWLFLEIWLPENLWLFRRFWVIFGRDESSFNTCLKHVGLLQQFCKSNQWTMLTSINSQFIPGSRSNYAWVDILRTAQHKGIMYQSLALEKSEVDNLTSRNALSRNVTIAVTTKALRYMWWWS